MPAANTYDRSEGQAEAVSGSTIRYPTSNWILLLLGLSVLINYIDRSNLSIAAPLIKDELGLSPTQLGTLLSAFFWTYACLQIPAGWLVDRFDVKWVFAAGFLIWSAATAVTGVLHGFTALLFIRVVLGVGESVAFPSYAKILKVHFRETHCGFANSVLMAGLALGPAIGMIAGASLVGRFGWRPFFVSLGLAGLLWLGPWVKWMPPARSSTGQKAVGAMGILDMLRLQCAWGTCICQFCSNYALYFLVTWLPFYLVRGRNLSMNQMGRIGGLVFLIAAASSIFFGKLSDRWIAAGGTPTTVRKGIVVVGGLGIGISLVMSALAAGNIFVWPLALLGMFLGMIMSNNWAITQILAGKQMAGRWTGVQNFVGNFAGAIAPALTGFLLQRTGQFQWPFFITAAISWIGAASYIFMVGPVEAVVWKTQVQDPSYVAAHPHS
jgi:ACS family D-galactonate transporter-like MFS transporter